MSKHYQQSLVVNYKGDGSPLTVADQAAHRVITDCLARSQIIIVSEEGENLHLEAEHYWLVDPLDGTKDFLAGNGEFTVNIALIEQSEPLLGVVFAPVLGEISLGGRGLASTSVDACAAVPKRVFNCLLYGCQSIS